MASPKVVPVEEGCTCAEENLKDPDVYKVRRGAVHRQPHRVRASEKYMRTDAAQLHLLPQLSVHRTAAHHTNCVIVI